MPCKTCSGSGKCQCGGPNCGYTCGDCDGKGTVSNELAAQEVGLLVELQSFLRTTHTLAKKQGFVGFQVAQLAGDYAEQLRVLIDRLLAPAKEGNREWNRP